ncbi:MAG: hypothetical protein NVSMB21_12790 [Vulcanimicrobiaceae bacterium]
MKHLSSITAAVLIGLAPLAASAAVTVGTQLTGSIDQSLSSNHATVGEPFTMSDVRSSDNNITGARVYGHVLNVQAAGQGTPGKIGLSYDRLVTRSGVTYAISGSTVSADTHTKSNAVKEIAGAAVGSIVGNYIGKHVGGIASGLGGIVGAGGGYVAAKNNRQNVEITPHSTVVLQVTEARRQASR